MAAATSEGMHGPASGPTSGPAGVVEVGLLLPVPYVTAMEQVAHRRGVTTGALFRHAVHDFLQRSWRAERPEDGLGEAREYFLRAVLGGQRAAAAEVVRQALLEGHARADVYVEVVQEALYEVGRLWQCGQASVGQEHAATAAARHVLAVLAEGLVRERGERGERGRAVVTAVEGEQHELGAAMVADLWEADGWEVRFLGSNVPREDVLAAVAEVRADVVGVAATMAYSRPRVAELAADLRRLGARRPRVVIGGRAFAERAEPAREVGADDHAPDLRAAVALLRGEDSRP